MGPGALAIGEGAVEFREVLERAGALIPDDHSGIHRVSAINHCRLALSMRGSSPDQVQPEYLRLPDAEINRRAGGLTHECRRVTIRPLGYSDLPQVIGIERRAFPTPWSLGMFVLELSKPSGVCLAARRATASSPAT